MDVAIPVAIPGDIPNVASFSEISDGIIYLTTLKLLTQGSNVEDLFRHLKSLTARYSLKYTTVENLLKLVLVYTTPVSRSIDSISELVKILTEEERTEDYEERADDYDVEEFANWISKQVTDMQIDSDSDFPWIPRHSIVPTASDLLHQTNVEAQKMYNKYSLEIHDDISLEEIKFSFVKAKFVQVSQYISDISEYSPLIKLCNAYQPFLDWYQGLIKPYFFYWNNFGITGEDPVMLSEFIDGNYYEKFALLVTPLSHKAPLNLWTTNVILPMVIYHNKDFGVVVKWMFHTDSEESGVPFLRSRTISEKFHFWNIIIRTILHNSVFNYEDFEEVIKCFIASCYFYSFADLSSIETLKIYDSIIETSKEILHSMEIAGDSLTSSETTSLNFDDIPTGSFAAFYTQTNPLHSWFVPSPSSISTLLQITTTCQKLFPTTKLTIRKYLNLKYSSDLRSKEREVLKITSTLNSTNSSTLLASSLQFMDTFLTKEEATQVSKLIVERFLQADLFDAVGQFYEDSQFTLSVSDYFEIVLEKFWMSYSSANNLNDKIGRLHEASQCVTLFDTLSNDLEFLEAHRNQVVRIKHLLKAIANMKNFRIVVEQNRPFTPSQILKFKPEDGEVSPLKLINVILELNPKSYLAFEKLYKILNDLVMFFEELGQEEQEIDEPKPDLQESRLDSELLLTLSPTYYFNKLKSACIESALIDNNFQYAYSLSKELFEFYRNDTGGSSNVNDIWLTLYQVGKYVSPSWFDSPDANMYDVLICQREILSLTLQYIQPSISSRDNSRVVLKQWQHINQQLEEHFCEELVEDIQYFDKSSVKVDRAEQLGSIANEIIGDATATTNQASEKLSNLFVSGLGWAIGARKH